MRLGLWKRLLVVMLLVLVLSTSGVLAAWRYARGSISSQSTDLSVSMSEFEYGPPEGVYITAVEVYSVSNNRTQADISFTLPTDFSANVTVPQASVTVTYKITVFNNTDLHQWYIGTDIDTSYGSNSKFYTTNGISMTTKDKASDSSQTFNTNDWVPPQTSRDFYVTYRYDSNAVGTTNTKVKFRFGLHMDAVYDGFLAVLNDKTSNQGYYYLVDQFEQKYAETGSTVIGNVGEDKAIFDHIFGKDLTIDIDGVPTPVTVLVERENVDGRPNQNNGTVTGDAYENGGPRGCEYTLYLTVDALNSPTGQAIVYAISYSCKADGTWYQIGQLYEGTATREKYDSTNNAFDVDSWEATTKTYYIGNNLYYHVAQKNHGTEYDYYTKIHQIQATNDQEFYNKINNSQILKKTWEIVTQNKNSKDPEYLLLKQAFEAMAPYYNLNNGPDIQIKREAPRSELLPYLEDLQEALDYYSQVHG